MAERQARSPGAEWKEEPALSPTEKPCGGGRDVRMRIKHPSPSAAHRVLLRIPRLRRASLPETKMKDQRDTPPWAPVWSDRARDAAAVSGVRRQAKGEDTPDHPHPVTLGLTQPRDPRKGRGRKSPPPAGQKRDRPRLGAAAAAPAKGHFPLGRWRQSRRVVPAAEESPALWLKVPSPGKPLLPANPAGRGHPRQPRGGRAELTHRVRVG